MTQNTYPKPVAHIYTFAFTWLFLALIGMPINNFLDFLGAFLIAFCMSIFVLSGIYTIRLIRKVRESLVSAANKVASFISPLTRSYQKIRGPVVPVFAPENIENPEFNAVITDGAALIDELKTAKRSIMNQAVVRKTEEVIEVSYKIMDVLNRQPQLLSSARRFFNHYLPTTTKLITNYNYMEKQKIKGENISGAMRKIEDSLQTLINAYKTHLDSLFSQTTLDLETDIEALENVLEKEGLLQNTVQNNAVQNNNIQAEAKKNDVRTANMLLNISSDMKVMK